MYVSRWGRDGGGGKWGRDTADSYFLSACPILFHTFAISSALTIDLSVFSCVILPVTALMEAFVLLYSARLSHKLRIIVFISLCICDKCFCAVFISSGYLTVTLYLVVLVFAARPHLN